MNLKKNWQKSSANSNTILRGDGFYISFNPIPVKSQHSETALVDVSNLPNRPIYILRGDHRLAYEDLLEQGFTACFAYYQANI